MRAFPECFCSEILSLRGTISRVFYLYLLPLQTNVCESGSYFTNLIWCLLPIQVIFAVNLYRLQSFTSDSRDSVLFHVTPTMRTWQMTDLKLPHLTASFTVHHEGKGKGKSIAVCETSPHRYGKSLTNGITQCYLPPGRGDFPAFTPAEAGTRFSDPKGCKAELT